MFSLFIIFLLRDTQPRRSIRSPTIRNYLTVPRTGLRARQFYVPTYHDFDIFNLFCYPFLRFEKIKEQRKKKKKNARTETTTKRTIKA